MKRPGANAGKSRSAGWEGDLSLCESDVAPNVMIYSSTACQLVCMPLEKKFHLCVLKCILVNSLRVQWWCSTCLIASCGNFPLFKLLAFGILGMLTLTLLFGRC